MKDAKMKTIYYKTLYFYDKLLDWVVFKFFNPYKVNPGGNCPVQAEGKLENGGWFYFRARGTRWSLEVFREESDFTNYSFDKPIFATGDANYRKWPEAGWLTRRECIKLATKGINKCYQNQYLILLRAAAIDGKTT